MGMLECTGKPKQSQTCPAELLLVLSPLAEMGTPAASGHSQQLPTSQTPGKISHKSFGKASFQQFQPVAQQQLCSPPVPEPGGTPGISLAGIPLPPTVQFHSCPSSKVPWGRDSHCHMGPLCQKWFSWRAQGCPVFQLSLPQLSTHRNSWQSTVGQRRAGTFHQTTPALNNSLAAQNSAPAWPGLTPNRQSCSKTNKKCQNP